MREFYLNKLRRNKFKMTPRRAAIVDIFLQEQGALAPEAVWKQLQRQFRRCGLPGVYRNLEQMADSGILTRIQKFGSKRSYALCSHQGNNHHHHIVCVQCGKIGELRECSLSQKRMLNGFEIIDHIVQVNGICAGCRTPKAEAGQA